MHYLTGGMHRRHIDLYRDGILGYLVTPACGYRIDHVAVWAVDNGAFTDAYPGDDAYLALLTRLLPHASHCLFVAVPDVLYDAAATLRQYPLMASRIAALGYPTALVGQDGMEARDVPWGTVDWLFVGGSNEWKMGPGGNALIRAAKNRGKRVHIGRVNSAKRFAWALAVGADSVDGNQLKFRPDGHLASVLSWLRSCNQMPLFDLWNMARGREGAVKQG